MRALSFIFVLVIVSILLQCMVSNRINDLDDDDDDEIFDMKRDQPMDESNKEIFDERAFGWLKKILIKSKSKAQRMKEAQDCQQKCYKKYCTSYQAGSAYKCPKAGTDCLKKCPVV